MELVAIVVLVALIQYTIFGALVGRARMKYKVEAPAVSGDLIFERYYRVHMNTLESLLMFVPSIFVFATYISADIAAGLGVIFVIGRQLYLHAYVKDPKSRELGFMLTFLPSAILALGGIVGAIMSYAG